MQALIEMKCPFHLKPHQIQGLKLNCKPLFPIVQWLVKSVIDYRRITGDITRNYSNFLFDSSTIDYSDNYLDQQSKASGRDFLINNVSSKYTLDRKYSKQGNTKFVTKENYVDATLLEYGFNFRAHIAFGAGDVDDGEGKGGSEEYPELNEAQGKGPKGGSIGGGNKLSAKYGDLMNKIGGGPASASKGKKGGKGKDDKKGDDVDENSS